MPAYNGQADVDRTLASFSEDAPVHVLIVDDGSTPPIVAPALPNLKIEVLRMPQNGGIEKALQTGIDALARARLSLRGTHRRGRPAACRSGSPNNARIWKRTRKWPASACGPRSSRAKASRFSC